MATITPTNINGVIKWGPFSNADTILEARVPPGTYNLQAYGTWGGGSVSLLHSLTTGPTVAQTLDGSTWAPTANTPVLNFGPVAEGFAKPSCSGTITSVTVLLKPSSTPEQV